MRPLRARRYREWWRRVDDACAQLNHYMILFACILLMADLIVFIAIRHHWL